MGRYNQQRTLADHRSKRVSQMRPLFVCPKVDTQDMVEFFGVCEVDDSTKARDGDRVDRAIFGRPMVVFLGLIS